MINLMENKVLAPLIQQRFEEGLEKGLEQGIEQGIEQGRKLARLEQQDVLLEQLSDKFGSVPPWAAKQLKTASLDDLRTWARRIIRAASLEETLR